MSQKTKSIVIPAVVLIGLFIAIGYFSVVVTIFGIVVLIGLHEAGHWIAARMVGISVPTFAIGFGRCDQAYVIGKLWGTEFQLRPIPLGGFIATEEQSYQRASLKARAFMMLAGPLANLLVPIPLLFALFALSGVPYQSVKDVYVMQTTAASIAQTAGIKAGDVLLSVEGASISTPHDFRKAMSERSSKPTALSIMRDGVEQTVVLSPGESGTIGVTLAVHTLIENEAVTPMQALSSALSRTGEMTWRTIKMYGTLLSGGAQVSDVSGIVGIVSDGSGHMSDFSDAITYLAMISIVLGIANLLPIPAFDGGQLTFLAVEAWLGRPLSPKAQVAAVKVTITLLVLIFVVSLVNDLIRLVGTFWATPLAVLIIALSVACFWPRRQSK